MVLGAYRLFICSLPPAMRSADGSSVTEGEAKRSGRTVGMEPRDDSEPK